MRSSKYHDYRALKIAAFIILVILGLFIYIKCSGALHEHRSDKWTTLKDATCTEKGLKCRVCTDCGEEYDHEVIDAISHQYKKVEVKSTCTKTGVTYMLCTLCGQKDDLKDLPLANHNFGNNTKKETIIKAKHTVPGLELIYRQCKDCKEYIANDEPTEIPAIGHTYSWELVQSNNELGEFIMIGMCTCGEEGDSLVVTKDNGLEVSVDADVPSCCRKIYIGKYTLPNGDEIYATTEGKPDPHKYDIYVKGVGHILVDADAEALYDDVYGRYYVIGTEGVHIATNEDEGLTVENVWDENGFAAGAYYCNVCETWYVAYIYSAEHDSNTNTNDSEI